MDTKPHIEEPPNAEPSRYESIGWGWWNLIALSLIVPVCLAMLNLPLGRRVFGYAWCLVVTVATVAALRWVYVNQEMFMDQWRRDHDLLANVTYWYVMITLLGLAFALAGASPFIGRAFLDNMYLSVVIIMLLLGLACMVQGLRGMVTGTPPFPRQSDVTHTPSASDDMQ